MQNRNQSDDQTVEQQRKLVAARRKHVGELAAKVRSARRQTRLDVVRDERRELLSAAKEYLWQKQKLDGMMPSDEQAEYADAFDMWGQVEEIDTKVAELNSKPALDVMAVLACDDAISKLHEKRAHLLHMESSEIEQVAQVAPATEQVAQHEQVQPIPAVQPRAMKRAALIAELLSAWPGIEDDLREASRNGLGAAKLGQHGMWNPDVAMEWAESRGKLAQQRTSMSPATWCGPITRHQPR